MSKIEPRSETIAAVDAREDFFRILTDVHRGERRVLIESDGSPVAAMVSPDDLDRLLRLDAQRSQRFAILDEIGEAFKDVSAEEIEREAARSVQQVRARSHLQSP